MNSCVLLSAGSGTVSKKRGILPARLRWMNGFGHLWIRSRITGRIRSGMWSERHVAYLCGLGTFGLSKGIITRKGMAGRFASLVTALELPADERPYKGLYDYCIRCGECIRRCPVRAISEEGKEHKPCHDWLLHVKKEYAPRLGCGKCQTAVPCESGIPLRNGSFSC